MLGQAATNTINSVANSRIFVYEVTGLKQSEQTDNSSYPVRTSSTTLVQVPYNRMNSEMQRINRLGAQIVNIYPLGQKPVQKAPASKPAVEPES